MNGNDFFKKVQSSPPHRALPQPESLSLPELGFADWQRFLQEGTTLVPPAALPSYPRHCSSFGRAWIRYPAMISSNDTPRRKSTRSSNYSDKPILAAWRVRTTALDYMDTNWPPTATSRTPVQRTRHSKRDRSVKSVCKSHRTYFCSAVSSHEPNRIKAIDAHGRYPFPFVTA